MIFHQILLHSFNHNKVQHDANLGANLGTFWILILKRNKWLAWQGSRINELETWSSCLLSVGLASCNSVGNLNIMVSWTSNISASISWAEKFSCCCFAGAWQTANYGRSSAGSGINQTVGFVDLKKPITLTLINWSLSPSQLQYCAESLEILRRQVFVVYSLLCLKPGLYLYNDYTILHLPSFFLKPYPKFSGFIMQLSPSIYLGSQIQKLIFTRGQIN